MPVRYDIAAQIPQYGGGGGYDPVNMMTQLQSMDYRQQQNVLAQMQIQKMQTELAQQNALRNTLSGLDINSPQAIAALSRGGNLPEALSLMSAQRQAEALRAQEAAQRASAGYQTGMLDLARAKLPLEQQKLQQEGVKEERLAGEAKLRGEKTALERDAEMLKNAENQAAKIVMAGGKGYDKFYNGLHDNLKGILPPQYDEQALSNFTTQMATVQENLKRHMPTVQAPTGDMPGMLISPRGVSKLPEIPYEQQGQTAWSAQPPAPVVTLNAPMKGGMVSMELPPEVMALQKTMALEEQIKRTAPIGREKEALGKFRFSNTLQGIGNTFVDLAKAKGVTVPGESPQETFEALANKSKFGQFFGKLDANERLSLVDSLKSQVNTAIPQFAAAAGLQSKNFDSNAEGERLRAALADPDNVANVSSAFRILNDLNKQFGSGTTLFEPKKEIQGIIGARRAAEAPKTEGVVDWGSLK